LKPEQIELVIHNPRIINGLVEFADGSIKAQMDASNLMRSIQFSMSYPNRMNVSAPRINLFDEPNLSFKQPDKTNFPNLNLAYSVLEKGGSFSAVLNASNKIAVEAFLEDQIKFTEIASINETMLNGHNTITNPSYEDFINAYHTACEQTLKLIK
jgi:1-deoxy-D-xylulose-5-phosphate reductoisomerase